MTTAKVRKPAISKAASEEAQEQIGRDILERIAALDRLKGEIAIGIAEFDAGHVRALGHFHKRCPDRVCRR